MFQENEAKENPVTFSLIHGAGSPSANAPDFKNDESTGESGDGYLGLNPPGRTPVVLAPGIISDTRFRLHGPVVISPDLKQICWAVIPPAIMSVSISSHDWSDPSPLPLLGRVVQSPAFSPDGKYLFYQAVGDDEPGRISIWRSQCTDDGWSAPASVGSNVNSDTLQSQPSLANNGTLYYTGTLKGVCFDRGIYRSRLIDGEYQKPELLCSSINSEYIDYCPWIAPDESYLLFASSRPRTEEPLYI
jgi:hypothetical protein